MVLYSCFGSDYLRLDGGVDDQINHKLINHRCFIRMHVPRKAAASRELWIRELAIPSSIKPRSRRSLFPGKGGGFLEQSPSRLELTPYGENKMSCFFRLMLGRKVETMRRLLHSEDQNNRTLQ